MSSPRLELPFTLLIVDDDDVAVEGVLRCLRRQQIHCTSVSAANGQEALDIVRRLHPEKVAEPPIVVLLDLNMPRLGGFGFLEALNREEARQHTTVFVLTTSAREVDRQRAQGLCIAGYLVKSDFQTQCADVSRLLLEVAHGTAAS